jgi:valyl-tRNA synthetase
MSKSLGNSIDPLEIISQTSADALRFSLMMLTATGQDVFINASKFEIGRNFGTKIWNAARFMLMQMEKMPQMNWHQLANRTAALNENNLTSDDRHIVAICDQAIANVTAHLEQFRFQDGALALYNLFWNEYCDWYLEYAKLALNGDDIARREQVLRVMTHVFSTALKLLHPYMPFLTEEIWHAMGYGKENESIMVAPWPQPLSAENSAKLGIDQETVTFVEAKHALITAGRALRSEYNLPPGKAIDYVVHAIDEKIANNLATDLASLKALLRSDKITIHAGGEAQAMPGMPTAIGTIYLPLEGLIDIDAEKKRLNSELTKLRGFVAGIDAKLNNAGFMAKAPANVVQGQRDKRGELVGNIERMERQLAALG